MNPLQRSHYSAPAVQAPASAIVVAYLHDPRGIREAVASLQEQTTPPAEIFVVDNDPDGAVGEALKEWELPIHVLHPGENLGYTDACNLAAEQATQPWLFFLNPDARAAPDCLERLIDAADERTALAGAQVLLSDGVTVNAGDNPVHITGLSWSGHYLEPREEGEPRETASISGAAHVTRANVFRELGGYPPDFFLYVDDTDMAWRARMAGWKVLFVPSATVVHDYEFQKGKHKWLYLERNRLWMVFSNYSFTALVLLAPLLIAAEFVIARQARRDGWWPEKVEAWRQTLSRRRALWRWRRHVQRGRREGDATLLTQMTGSIDTPLVRSPLLVVANPWMERYRRAMQRALS